MDQPGLALEALKAGPTRKRNMDQKMAIFRYLLGTAYLRTNDRKRALAEFKKVYIFDTDFDDVENILKELENENA